MGWDAWIKINGCEIECRSGSLSTKNIGTRFPSKPYFVEQEIIYTVECGYGEPSLWIDIYKYKGLDTNIEFDDNDVPIDLNDRLILVAQISASDYTFKYDNRIQGNIKVNINDYFKSYSEDKFDSFMIIAYFDGYCVNDEDKELYSGAFYSQQELDDDM
jgi:hypothetical protein